MGGKTRLINLGDGGVGRVPLADFYKSSIDDNTFEFQESESYLRELGALDESDPSHPSVIIPNYIQSATSCIASIVSNLSSSTVEAPRTLSPTLLGRLDEAAAHHGGTVQLHGRLFGQWMHNAFPRECPLPHVSGTTNPSTPDEWMSEKGEDSFASKSECASLPRLPN